jgi:chromate transporter
VSDGGTPSQGASEQASKATSGASQQRALLLFSAPTVAALPTPLVTLTALFFKMGLTLFGGGVAMIPIIHDELIERLGWLSARELADAIVVGQLTPGPIATLSSFVGWRIGGAPGALVATAALFSGPLLLAIVTGHSMERLRQSRLVPLILDGAKPVVIGSIFAAAWMLGRSTVVTPLAWAILIGSVVALLLRVPSLVTLALAGGVVLLAGG